MANIDKIKVNGTTYNIIDTTSGYITSANDIYWCTYGTTASAEIETAINAGKCPMVKYTNYTYTLRYRNSSTNHRFVCNYGGKEYSVVCQSSTWMPDGTLTFLTSAPVTSVNTKTGAVSLTASDVGALPSSTSIPTKTSDLTNDSGFITSAPVDSVNGQTGTVVLTASDVNALPSSTSIPTKTSDLTNDSGFITSAPVDSVNGQTGVVVLTASDVSALPDSTTIPTKTSDLTNDSGFVSSSGIVDVIYPVGSIYISVNNVNPSTLWANTTWEAWGSGKAPIGVDANDTDFALVEQTGGSKSVSYTPAGSVSQPTFTGSAVTSGVPSNNTSGSTTLTTNQIPSHTHTYTRPNTGQIWEGSDTENIVKTVSTGIATGGTGGGQGHTHTLSSHTHSVTASGTVSKPSFTGTAQSISTVQPYITCYMWKRTA